MYRYRDAGVGTLNPAKIRGARRALRHVGVVEVSAYRVVTGIEQPRGIRETLLLALRRAREALRDHDLGVGIEAGVVFIAGYPVDAEAAVVVTREGYAGIGLSPGFPLPPGFAAYLRRGATLGDYMESVTGRPGIGRGLGAVGVLSRGLISRSDLSYYAVLTALFPFMNPGLYGEPVSMDSLEEILKTLGVD